MYENDTVNLNAQIVSLKHEIDSLMGLQITERDTSNSVEVNLVLLYKIVWNIWKFIEK